MKCLFLNLASHKSLLACVGEESIVASQDVTTRIRDDELLALVEKLLEEGGWTYDSLTNIACVTGPGGFTSLRVAITFANVLADQLQIPIVGIHLSALYAARASYGISKYHNDGTSNVLWLHSTKRDSLFVCGGRWKEPTLISFEELSAPLGDVLWCGELLSEHEAAVTSLGLIPVALRDVIEILPSFLPTLHFEKRPLLPWYGRDG